MNQSTHMDRPNSPLGLERSSNRNRLLFTIIFTGILGWGGALALAQVPGSLSGKVQTTDGQPLADAIVSVSAASGAGISPQTGSGRTTADGSFSFSGLPSGSYRVCVHATRKELLDPCTWAMNTISIAAGQTLNAGPIQVATGHLLKVHIADNGKAMAAAKSRTPGQIQAGVWTNDGLFLPMRLAAVDASGRDFELYVPDGVPLQVGVSSREFDLVDENGGLVDSKRGSRTTVQLQAGPDAKVLTYRVTGGSNARKQ